MLHVYLCAVYFTRGNYSSASFTTIHCPSGAREARGSRQDQESARALPRQRAHQAVGGLARGQLAHLYGGQLVGASKMEQR